MKYLLMLLTASLMLAGISCNRLIEESKSDNAAVVQTEELRLTPPQAEGVTQEENKQIPVKNANENWDKKIVKTAIISIETDNYKKFNDDLHQLMQKWEGYTAREEEKKTDYNVSNTLTIKVPVAQFDDALNSIFALNGKTINKHISSEDVTSEVFDTRGRIEAKKRIRTRYFDMLGKAKNMEEILQVEREIGSIQEQIEAAEGRLKYLSHTAAYSTIELTFFQVTNTDVKDQPEPGYAKRLLTSLNEGLKFMGNTIIFFAAFWPLWLALILFYVLIKKFRFGVNTK